MSADSLVAIHKRVVADKPESQLRRFRLQRWIDWFPTEGLKRSRLCGFQKPLVPDPVAAAELLDQCRMQGENLFLR